MTDLLALKQYLKIDRVNLDTEVIQHPDLYHRVSEAYVGAVDARDQAKEFLADTKAQAYLSIRRDREQKKLKYTETVLTNEVAVDKAVENARDDYLAKKKTADDFGALKAAMEQKAYMLRELVALYVAGYYSTGAINENKEDVAKTITETRRNKPRQTVRRRTTR